jgi:hypothetical protein
MADAEAERNDHRAARDAGFVASPAVYVVTFVAHPQAFYCEDHLREADAALERGRP